MRIIRFAFPLLLLLMVLTFSLSWTDRLAPVLLGWAGIRQLEIDLAGWDANEVRIDSLHLTLDHSSGPIAFKVTDAVCRYRIFGLLQGKLEAVAAASVDIALPQPVAAPADSPGMVLPDLAKLLEQLQLRNLPVQQVHLSRLLVHRGPVAAKNQVAFTVDLSTTGNERRLRIDSTASNRPPPLTVHLQRTDEQSSGSLHLDLAGLQGLWPQGESSTAPLQGIVKVEIKADLHPAAKMPLQLACTVSALRHPLFSAEEVRLQLDSTQPLSPSALILAPTSRLSLRNAQSQGVDAATLMADLSGQIVFDDHSFEIQLKPVTPWSIEGLTFGAVRLAPVLFRNLSLHLQADRSLLQGDCSFAAPLGRGTIKADFSHRLTGDSRGNFSLQTEGPLQMSENSTVRELLVTPELAVALHKGALTFSARSHWRLNSPPELQTAIELVDGQGTLFEAPFSGLTLRQQLRLLPVMESITPGLVQLTEMQGPVPAKNFVMKIHLRPSPPGKGPNLLIEEAAVQLFNGSIGLENCMYARNSPHDVCLLHIDNLDVQPLIALQKVDGLTGSGRVHGQLPLQFSPQGMTIHHGKLENDADGGIIRYQPGGSTVLDSPLTVYALKALEELHYHRLAALIDYLPDGTLTLSLQLQGKNPKLEAGRPVHLNITTEQNLLSLLKSLQYSHGLAAELDRTIRQQSSSQPAN